MTHLRTLLAAAAVAGVAATPALAQQQQQAQPQQQQMQQQQAQPQQQQQEATDQRHERLAKQVAPPEGVGGPVVAMSRIFNREGLQVGAASFQAAPNGTLLRVAFAGLPPGPHGFHVHESGVCEGDFQSAGGHYNPDDQSHGFWHEEGPHAGDLPNVFVPQGGDVTVEFFNERLRVNDAMFEGDGTSMVVHAATDDHRSQPAGDSGDRIACGVVERVTPQAAEGEQAPQ